MWPGVVVAVLLIQSASTSPHDWQAEGLRALEQNNYPAAIEALTKAVAADPKDYSAHFNLALAESLAGRDSEAQAEYRRTLELKPDLYQANLNLGILLLRDKQPEPAVAVLERARAARPNEFRPALYLGEALFASGNTDGASEAYEAALKLNPKSAAAELGVAHVLVRRKQVAEAAPHFEQAAKLDASYKDVLLELAQLYETDKKTTEALAVYDQFPENAAAQEHAGQLLLEAGNRAGAIPRLETAVRLSPTSANRLALASAYCGNKEIEKGVQVLNQALTNDPKNYDLRMLAGRVLRDHKQYPNAIRQFQAAVAIQPDSTEAWSEIAASAQLGEEFQLALSALDRLKALGAEKPPHLYFRAIMLDKLKQLQPALDYYRQFLAVSRGQFPDEEFKARQRARILQREIDKR